MYSIESSFLGINYFFKYVLIALVFRTTDKKTFCTVRYCPMKVFYTCREDGQGSRVQRDGAGQSKPFPQPFPVRDHIRVYRGKAGTCP